MRPGVPGALLLAFAAQLFAANPVLPPQPVPFTGTLAPTEDASEGVMPTPLRAPDRAPNILLVMTDDVGFASASTFGGAVPTPSLDRLADAGLRYNRFHTTGICSPTRAALLTGRNHHSVGSGLLVELNSPYPGYRGIIPPSTATIARILRDNGYNTAMFGKDHNVPAAARSPAGPFDQWPTGRGFEYFYGFVAGDTDQFRPALFRGISPVDGADRPDDYLLDRDLADELIHWVHNQQAAAPGKPFFAYLATGSSHAPHQAPREWIERFRGQYDHGWDVERARILARQKALGIVPEDTTLSARPDIVPAWDTLSETQQAVAARYMEVYAAMLAFQDHQFGRIMAELERMGIADNTLVAFIQGDNGSSGEAGEAGTINELVHLSVPHTEPDPDPEWLQQHLDLLGGPDTYQGYPLGWTFATGTPFPWFKQHASHLGGVRNGLVIAWPERISRGGEVRTQYHHVIDVVPTLLEAAGLAAPERVDGVVQKPIEGKSMVYSFDDPQTPSPRRTQYYEVAGNRGIYHDGWLANTTPRNMPWQIPEMRPNSDVTTYGWELYNLEEDFSQSNDLAKEHPERLATLRSVFDREARAYDVYPIQDSGGMYRARRMMQAGDFRTDYVYWGAGIQVTQFTGPPIFNLPFTLEADVVIPEQGGQGVMFAAGSQFSGWSFYLHEGKPVAYAAVSGLPLPGLQSRVAAERVIPPGRHLLRFDVAFREQGALVKISVDGEAVASGTVSNRPLILAGGGETMDVGFDANTPVSPDYHSEGRFSGEIRKLEVRVKPPAASTSGAM